MQWKPSYIFEDHNEGMAFMRQNKPPVGMKWAINNIQVDEDEYSSAVTVTAVESWPIGHPALYTPDKWTLESGDPIPAVVERDEYVPAPISHDSSYRTRCLRCKTILDSGFDSTCMSCGWLKCQCGACGCQN